MTVRSIHDVPSPSRASKAVREAQLQYEGYIQSVGTDVGELTLGPDEKTRSVKISLHRAASRLGKDIEVWNANGNVYFQVSSRARRSTKAS